MQDNSHKVNDRSMEYEKYGMQFFWERAASLFFYGGRYGIKRTGLGEVWE